MDVKESLITLKNKLVFVKTNKNLEKKISSFLVKYEKNVKNIIENNFSVNPNDYDIHRLKDFINKIVALYEDKYSNDYLDSLMYLDLKKEDIWGMQEQEYNKFWNSLSISDKNFLRFPKYFNREYKGYSILEHLQVKVDNYGKIYWYDCDDYIRQMVDFEIIGMNISELYERFTKKYISIDETIELIINQHSKDINLYNELFDCIMYQMILNGGMHGAKRAFMFAREFCRSTDISMIYGLDYSDQDLIPFIHLYLKFGGSESLVCYISNLNENSKIATIKKIIDNVPKDEKYPLIRKERK